MRRAVIIFLLYLISNSLLSQINYNWILPTDEFLNSFQLTNLDTNKFAINSVYSIDGIATSGVVLIDEYSFSLNSYQGYIPTRNGINYYEDKLYAITSLIFPNKRIYKGELTNMQYSDTVSISSDSDFFSAINCIHKLDTTYVAAEDSWNGGSNRESTVIKIKGDSVYWRKNYNQHFRRSFTTELEFSNFSDDIFMCNSVNLPDVLQAYPQIMKINTNGDTLWTKLGHEQKDAGSPLWIAELSNGNIVQSYEIYKFLDLEYWENDWYWYPTVLNWYTPTGKLIKSKTLITPGKHRLSFNQMKKGQHGDYFFAYGVYEEIDTDNFYGFLTKYNNEGDTIWAKKYQHIDFAGQSYNHIVMDIAEMEDGSINLLISIGAPGLETWLLTVDSEGCHQNLPCNDVQTITSVVESPEPSPIALYPNPAHEILTIDITEPTENLSYKIYSAVGNLVLQGKLDEPIIDIRSLESGSFILQIVKNEQSISNLKFLKF